jgi:hypothetical protein
LPGTYQRSAGYRYGRCEVQDQTGSQPGMGPEPSWPAIRVWLRHKGSSCRPTEQTQCREREREREHAHDCPAPSPIARLPLRQGHPIVRLQRPPLLSPRPSSMNMLFSRYVPTTPPWLSWQGSDLLPPPSHRAVGACRVGRWIRLCVVPDCFVVSRIVAFIAWQ